MTSVRTLLTRGLAPPVVVLALALVPALAPAGTDRLAVRATVSGGYLDHPVGVAAEEGAGYMAGSLAASLLWQEGPSTWKVGYEGTGVVFGNDVNLGFQRHAVGLEWWRTDPASRAVTAAGFQVGRRLQEEFYSFFDFTEYRGYLSLKRYLSGSLLWRGRATVRSRRYDDLPEESYLEGVLGTSVQRFWAGGTSLTLSGSLGGKVYDDDAARAFWGGATQPTTSQAAAALRLSRSLSPRVGLRLAGSARWSLSTFPYVVGEDLYDSPLLDRYASEGYLLDGSLKILLPWPAWLRLGGSVAHDDYGELLFAGTTGGEARVDDIVSVFAGLEKRLGGTGRSPSLNLTVSWRDQSSTLDYYDFSGWQVATALVWSR